MRGKFIAVEGLDFTGKTTQIELLGRYLRAKNVPYTLTREPGGSPVAERIRGVLLDGANPPGGRTSFLLFNACRAENLERTITPALGEGRVVVCDRFLGSTIVYQGILNGISKGDILWMHNTFLHATYPDLTIVLDAEVSEVIKRREVKTGITKMEALKAECALIKSVIKREFEASERDFFPEDLRRLTRDYFPIFAPQIEDEFERKIHLGEVPEIGIILLEIIGEDELGDLLLAKERQIGEIQAGIEAKRLEVERNLRHKRDYNSYDFLPPETMEQIRRGFLNLPPELNPRIINTMVGIDETFAQIRTLIDEIL